MLTDIRQLFDADITDALFNANAPTAANPFATMADVAGAGVNIYNSDGSLTGDRVVTLDTFDLRFDLSNTGVAGDCFIIGGSGPNFARNTYPIQFQANTVIGGSLGIGGSGGAGSPYLEFSGSAAIGSMFSNGEIVLRSGVGSPIRLQTNASTTDVITITSAGLVGISDNSPTAKLFIHGAGTTTATIGFEVENSAGTSWFRVYDEGTFWSQGLSDVAHLITTFGNSMEVRYNGVVTSTFTMQVNGSTVSSFVNQSGLSRFNQATNQDWGVYGDDNMPYLLFDESNKRVVIGATSGLNSIFEVVGDVETRGAGNGLVVLDDTDATRYRIFTSNGVVTTEAA